MQFSLFALALAALAIATPEAEPAARRVKIAFPVCNDNIAACCQTSVTLDKRFIPTDLNCLGAGNPTSIKKFHKICAAAGRTSRCCNELIDATGSECYSL